MRFPKALHANMFLVRSAAEIMERDVLVLDEGTQFAAFLAMAAAEGGLRHVVVTRGGTIVGGLRVNTDLRRALGAAAGNVRLGDLVRPNFTIVREREVAFDVIATIWKRRAAMAIVISQRRADARACARRHHQGACGGHCRPQHPDLSRPNLTEAPVQPSIAMPPLTCSTVPVIQPASSEAR